MELERDINPPQEYEKNTQIFCYNRKINKKTGKFMLTLPANLQLDPWMEW